jgi:hypothetical protein
MRLSQHWNNVASAGHQWNTTLNNGNWNYVILQDQSQVPGFPRSQNEWIASKDGAVELSEVIEDNGGETVLMMTWGRRNGDSNNAWRFPDFSTMQEELASGYLDYRDNISANGGNAWVAPVGLAFEHIHDKIVAEGGTPTNSGNTFYNLYTGDGSHPSLSGSYLAAAVIYATITGKDPVGLSHTTSLSNGLVLELQQAAAATVFNETSHLAYPWQTNFGIGHGQNINTTPFPNNLAPYWIKSIGGSGVINKINDVVTTPEGDAYVMGTYRYVDGPYNGITAGNCYDSYSGAATTLYIAKFDRNGNCVWIQTPKFGSDVGHFMFSTSDYWSEGSLAIDQHENVYMASYITQMTMSGAVTIFGNYSVGGDTGVIAKIDSNGSWKWAISTPPLPMQSVQNLEIDGNGILWYSFTTISGSYLQKYNLSGGNIDSISIGNTKIWDFSIDHSGEILLTGLFDSSFSCNNNGSSQTFSPQSGFETPFILKMDSTGNCLWFSSSEVTSALSIPYSLEVDSNGNSFITGRFYDEITFDNTTLDAGGNQNGFLAKINQLGQWEWANQIYCSCTTEGHSVTLDYNDSVYLTGLYNSGLTTIGGSSFSAAYGSKDTFLLKLDQNGNTLWALTGGGSGNDRGMDIAISNDTVYMTGSMTSDFNFGTLKANMLSSNTNQDTFLLSFSKDYDFDGTPDIIDSDDDGDFIEDPLDSCHYSPIGFTSAGSSDHDSDGCDDETEDDDDDNDQLNDTLDSCPKGMTGWIRTNASDLDDDGCMDALEDYDDDNDGFEDYEDYCSRIPGNSTFEFEKGCPDADGDGRPDILDPFKDDPAEWSDMDGDGVGDNSDAFPSDATQQYDTDGDTYGDEEFGNAGDSCPTVFGNSTIDRYGCLDTDGDGWSDEGDDFPLDPTEYLDSDSDGYPDSSDDFPFDPTQWKDSDGDGYGDNVQGNLGDAYPNDASRYADSDRDGIDDQADAFPYDPTQWEDADGDGMGDNPMGIGADKFPDDPTQWGDIDGDGYGDNSTGNNPDAFPTDATQWSDMDGDGYGDNPTGRLYDLFPENPTQWEDADGDGLGDNQSGTDADPYLNDFDNDGYNDTIDILPRVASPGDLDNDKCMDGDDDFWDNPLECLDTDGDGIGNNADGDDDNDEWTDADEIRANTDPLDPNDTPVDSFEIQIGNIGLGAWDLIGIFGGVPIFGWILFGFVTRNARCARFEEDLESANSREELEQVALRWEYSLMLRLLGPHQGIRLERLRSELDDKFENAELLMSSDGYEPMTDVEQAPIVEAEEKNVPAIETTPSPDTPPDQTDEHGYSWLNYNGENWYRTASDTEWTRHE